MKQTFLLLTCFAIGINAVAQELQVEAFKFNEGKVMQAPNNDGGVLKYTISSRQYAPFSQSSVKQNREPATYGIKDIPYYNVRFALPVPAAYTPTEQGMMVGLDKGVYTHLHSAGMDVLPNGDVLAVYFSTPMGKAEADTCTTFVQARRRCGSLEWDMPELFFDTYNGNDQSALLWRDGDKVWFFGGGRDMSDWVPFRYCTTTDNGMTWTYNVPKLSEAATEFTAQPISNAFRDKNGNIYMAMDGKGSTSFLWKSSDEGHSWTQMKGRTGARHSTIVPLDDNGTLLSIGGKNTILEGWTPQNISHDWGETWEASTPSPFPPLGTAQRPCMIRLQSGKLLLVTDSYMHKKKIAPPAEWKNGNDCVVAISADNGKTWKIKSLPLTLPQHHRIEHPSLGYVTLRQAENGMIHVLTTTNYPGLEIEFNEAWVESESNQPTDLTTLTTKCQKRTFVETYPDGKRKLKWSAKIYDDGRYLLDGKEVCYFSNGKKEHEVTYIEGRKSGKETFYYKNGGVRWTWERDLKKGIGVWTQYYENGKKRVESRWDLNPSPRDLPHQSFIGYVAEGPAKHYDKQGRLIATYNFHEGVAIDNTTSASGGILNEGQ